MFELWFAIAEPRVYLNKSDDFIGTLEAASSPNHRGIESESLDDTLLPGFVKYAIARDTTTRPVSTIGGRNVSAAITPKQIPNTTS